MADHLLRWDEARPYVGFVATINGQEQGLPADPPARFAIPVRAVAGRRIPASGNGFRHAG
jgi:hypothetical protein